MSYDNYDDDGFMGGGAPAVKFENIGDSVTGIVLGRPEKVAQTEMGTNKIRTFDDGSVRYQFVVEILTELRDPDNPYDDGTRRLFLKWKQLDAVRAAIKASGSRGLEKGGVITVTFTAFGPKGKYAQPPKIGWTAIYIPPDDSFMGPQETQQAPVNTTPPPPPPPAPPVASATDRNAVMARLKAQVTGRQAPTSFEQEEPPF